VERHSVLGGGHAVNSVSGTCPPPVLVDGSTAEQLEILCGVPVARHCDIDRTVQVPLADLPPGPPEWLPPGHPMSNFPPRRDFRFCGGRAVDRCEPQDLVQHLGVNAPPASGFSTGDLRPDPCLVAACSLIVVSSTSTVP